MTTPRIQPTKQDVIPGIDAHTFEELKKAKLVDALTFDEQVRHDAKISLDEFIKKQEELSKFIQQQINDKAKADKEAAKEDAASQQSKLDKSIQAQQVHIHAYIALLKELSEIGIQLETKEKELEKAHKRSQTIITKMMNKIVDDVSKLLSPKNQIKLKEQVKEQMERRETEQFKKLEEQKIRELHKTYEFSPPVGTTSTEEIANLMTYQLNLLTQITPFHALIQENREKQLLKSEQQPEKTLYTLQEEMQNEISVIKKEQIYKERELTKRVKEESLSDSYKDEQMDIIAEEAVKKIKTAKNAFNEAIHNLRTIHTDKISLIGSTTKSFKNANKDDLKELKAAVVDKIKAIHGLDEITLNLKSVKQKLQNLQTNSDQPIFTAKTSIKSPPQQKK